ncbi:hypothetical protein [Streptomyces fragilis]|uniref:Restriction endonuclease n=1 Tax=Streptomyces fragilis TaxID=67301 RepID=A0ABV2YC91_9ACTN|nr:hypothetical protein [Streptomyces fragilis]
MTDRERHLKQLELARHLLGDLAGEDIDAIDIKSVGVSEAPFLAKIVSKLSPMVGNLMEQRIVHFLDAHANTGFSWMRQDPGFPDALLLDDGRVTGTGIEIKAWYVLSTEITGRFKESQNLLAGKNIDVVIVAWCMSHMIFGKPKILGVLGVPGADIAASRDFHYHNPPEYLIIEPQDTSRRSNNLQQSNVNGYRLQDSDCDVRELRAIQEHYRLHPFTGSPPSREAQEEAAQLKNKLIYRMDTNFAKIDRIDNPHIEEFKSAMLTEEYLGLTISQWKSIFRDLNGTAVGPRTRAERVIRDLYDGMLSRGLE